MKSQHLFRGRDTKVLGCFYGRVIKALEGAGYEIILGKMVNKPDGIDESQVVLI